MILCRLQMGRGCFLLKESNQELCHFLVSDIIKFECNQTNRKQKINFYRFVNRTLERIILHSGLSKIPFR